jgi:AcrR family transcriptional regulator
VPPATRPARPTLSRAAVVAEAVALADAEGIDAVSMRALAGRLGVVPMALYKHVADKEDLLDGMVDHVIDGFAPPAHASSAGEWKDAVRGRVLAARTAVAAHPWARRAIETRTRRTPTVLRHMDTLTGLLLAGGFTPDLAHHAMHALGNRIWGFSPELFNDPGSTPAPRPSAAPDPDPADYPAIVAVAADATARRPGGSCDEDFEFAFALDLVLDAVGRLSAAGWTSPR